MAFNPSSKVADCRDIAQKWGKPQIIILAIDPIAGTLEYASYGESKAHCAEARKLADVAYQAIMDKYEE